MIKRTFDICLSLFGIVLFSPLFIAVAIGILLTSPGPILFRGRRVVKGGNDFEIYKFRSMVVDAEKLGGTNSPAGDERVTKIGAILRKTKLDELPQLFNVLFGSMSFVGPRPQVRWIVDLYNEEEKKLLSVKQGIVDYASLYFRNQAELLKDSENPDKDYFKLIAPKKVALGLYYVRTHNFIDDCKIIIATVLSLVGVDPAWCIPQDIVAEHDKDLETNPRSIPLTAKKDSSAQSV